MIYYKAVRKIDNRYFSDYDNTYEYVIGEYHYSDVDVKEDWRNSKGLHVTELERAIRFGTGWDDIAVLECFVEPEDVIKTEDELGISYRTSKLKVIKEYLI